MTELHKYVIRRGFVVPLFLLILLTVALLVTCVVQGQPVAKAVILGVLILPLVALLIETGLRRIEITAEGVTAFRPLRQKQIAFNRVTALETVRVRNRVFLTLVAGDDDFLIISNSYSRFPELLQSLVAALPEQVITEETRQLAADPPVRHADVFTAWFAVAALVYVLVAQFVR